jgi:prophage endopeptidase
LDRDELTLAVAGTLFGAVVLGWVLHWLFARIARAPGSARETAGLAARLYAAEAAAGTAEQRRAELEADLGQRLADAEAELARTLDELAAARRDAEDVREAYRRAMAPPDA